MTGDQVTIASPSIAGAQPDVTRFILNSDDLTRSTYLRLHGYVRGVSINRQTGEFETNWVQNKELAYNPKFINWIDSKLDQTVNKNQLLSYYCDPREMNKEALYMVLAFIDELYLKLKEFGITDTGEYTALINMYSNITAQVVRHALGGGTKDFLGKTTSETTTKVSQDIREQNQKGIIPTILGR